MKSNFFRSVLSGLVGLGLSSVLLNASVIGQTENTPSDHSIKLSADDDGVSVKFGDQLFTRYEFSKYGKPVFYPVIAAQDVSITRHWPMKKIAGEANDHPHHKSIWIGHEVNGVDFWANKTGDIKFQKLESLDVAKQQFSIRNQWIKREDQSVVLTEASTYRFGGDKQIRWIDATITFKATHDDVVFEDTKEGLFAIRTHPNLRLSPNPKAGVVSVNGQALNSNGDQGKSVWGKAAKWVNYWGEIEGHSIGIAIFDHPHNIRHPSTWHAREYGLVAANPFGLHYFKRQPKGAGQYKIPKGDSLTLRYRMVFHSAAQNQESIERWYSEFANVKPKS